MKLLRQCFRKLSHYNLRMRALVTRGHFRSRDKDDGHTIRSAIAETPCYTQTSWLYVLCNRSYCLSKFYFVRIGIFDFFLLWLWPSPDDLHIRTWPVFPRNVLYQMCKYELPTLTRSKVIVWQTNGQTDRQTRPKLYSTPLRGWSIKYIVTLSWLVLEPPLVLRVLITERSGYCFPSVRVSLCAQRNWKTANQ